MAYIQPNSVVQLFPDLGLDSSYDNSLCFNSTVLVDGYFDNIVPLATAQALSYSRTERGFVRIEKPISQVIGAGYMRFKNTSFENKWFYAFVTSVEYINNVTTQINFEIDVLMTWAGNYTFNDCFIERQHASSDNIGENLVTEPLQCSDYRCEHNTTTEDYMFARYEITAYKTPDTDEDASRYNHGLCNLSERVTFPLSRAGVGQFMEWYDGLSGTKQREIYMIKIQPSYFDSDNEDYPVTNEETFNKPWTNYFRGLPDAYTPRNKKLFTYPYKFLRVTNTEGSTKDYYYELFQNPTHGSPDSAYKFMFVGSSETPNAEVMCYPEYYRGIYSDYDNAIRINNFPSVAWNDDAYKAYAAQRDSTFIGDATIQTAQSIVRNPYSVSGVGEYSDPMASLPTVVGSQPYYPNGTETISPMLGMLRSFLSAPAVGRRAADRINELLGTADDRFTNVTRGSLTGDLLVQMRAKNFYFKEMCIRPEMVKQFDQYFDMYGYAQNKVGKPNRQVRQYWTYIKTVGCSIDGNLPADDARKIESIYDNGCRFWTSHTNIGNYSLTNAIIPTT